MSKIDELKKHYLQFHGWVEVLKDYWVPNGDIKDGTDYYKSCISTDKAYEIVYDENKKSIVNYMGCLYQITTDPYKVGDWVYVPDQMLGFEHIAKVTENDINVFPSINAMKILATNNKDIKDLPYLIVEQASPIPPKPIDDNKEDEVEIEEPVGKFIIDHLPMEKGKMGTDGLYIHFSDVCQLMTKYHVYKLNNLL